MSQQERPSRLPPLNALRAFECAARHLSFQRAADELCVTPAAISQQIRSLEDELSVELFVRHHRRVELTEMGRQVAEPLHVAFSSIRQAVGRASQARSSLRISTIASFASKWLVPRLHRFQLQHPHIQVHVSVDDHLSRFAPESIDVAIRYGPGGYQGLFAELLCTADVFPVCHPDLVRRLPHPLRQPKDLRHHVLLHDRSSEGRRGVPCWGAWLAYAGSVAVDSRRGPTFDSIYLAQEAAIAGQGVALGIEPLVADDIARKRLAVPFGPRMENRHRFWFVCQRARRDEPNVRAFRLWLAEESRSTVVG